MGCQPSKREKSVAETKVPEAGAIKPAATVEEKPVEGELKEAAEPKAVVEAAAEAKPAEEVQDVEEAKKPAAEEAPPEAPPAEGPAEAPGKVAEEELSPPVSPTRSPGSGGDDYAKASPDGLYLLFDQANQGTFQTKYSKEYIPEALAFAKPGPYVTIATFKYKAPQALMTKVQMGKKSYFEAWLAWIKEARQVEGEFVLLSGLEDKERQDPTKFPSMKMITQAGAKVVAVQKGLNNRPVKLKYVEAVACVPESYAGLDAAFKRLAMMERQEFATKAKTPQDYAYTEF